jgi:hypothetical protein
MSTWFRLNSPAVVFDASADDTVIINLVSGRYFRLNAASSLAWKALLASGSREAFVASAGNAPELVASIDSMIEALTAEKLIVPVPAGETTAEATSWAFAGFSLESFSDLEDILGLDPIHEADPDKGWPAARD